MPVMTRPRVKKEQAQVTWPATREEIARVAYELFERRGQTHGGDQQDWFEAERILRPRRRGDNGR